MIDWPDLPGLPDFPDLPSPGEVLENMLRSLSEAMKADAEAAVRSVLDLIVESPGPDFMSDWIRLLFSLVFGLALVATIFVSMPIIFVSSLSRSMKATERMIHTATHAVKLLFFGYMMLPIYAVGFFIAGALATAFNQINKLGEDTSPSDSLGSLFGVDGLPSIFGDLGLNALIMGTGGFLNIYLQLVQYSLAPLAIVTPLVYSVRQINIWGHRLWKLFVGFVCAIMFTTPVVVLIISVASQTAAFVTSWNSTVQGVFLLGTLMLGAFVPLVIMLLTYVGYTIQVGKSRAEVEGRVQTMPLSMQHHLYGRHISEMVNQRSSSMNQDRRPMSSRPSRERVMTNYVRTAASSGVDLKIGAATAATATKVASTVGGVPGKAAAVGVHAVGAYARNKSRKTIEGGGR